MRIGIIGAGHIGGTLARLFVDGGHEVAVSNSRGPETLESLVEELGDRAQTTTAADAALFGDVVVVSVPFGRYRELPTEAVMGKVVIDTNNYYPQRDGHFEELDSDRITSSELLQAHPRVPGWSRPSTRSSGSACATTAVPLVIPSGLVFPSRATTIRRSKLSQP